MVMNAAYTYFIAAAGPAEKRWMAEVALTRGYEQITAAADQISTRSLIAQNAEQLGRLLYAGSGARGLSARARVAGGAVGMGPEGRPGGPRERSPNQQKARVDRAVRDRAAALRIEPIRVQRPGADRRRHGIVVRRKRMGTITLDDLPREEREG